MMRAEHLKYFVALAENHSITKTSLEFYTSHQSVSKVIRQLEEEMGTALFVRSQKGMTLTPEGEVLLPVARARNDARLSAGAAGYLPYQSPESP